MNDRLKTIVDLENYPIHDLSSSKIQKLIKKCKEDLINLVVLLFQISFYQNQLKL
jgi:hypothetical protein